MYMIQGVRRQGGHQVAHDIIGWADRWFSIMLSAN